MVSMQDSSQLESERPHVVTEPRIATPALIVLLGTTPALAGLELMRHMLSLQTSDMRRVAVVYIDTDEPPNVLVDFQRQYKGLFHEFSLRVAVPTGVERSPRIPQRLLKGDDATQCGVHVDDPAGPNDEPREQHTFIDEKLPQYFASGAGGIRNNGHVAACFHYHSIYSTLDAALSQITLLGTEQGEVERREVQVNIVAFLGGGTGSGILADVAVMIRELLGGSQLSQRINLFCLLPEQIKSATDSDLRWRKSNATACLLELLAFSLAAGGDPDGNYEKYMRKTVHRLTNDPIANEVYLVGRASMGDAVDTARIIGIDLFQRITNASGVGKLEHSKWVDRRGLGKNDDLGLPTMFGTTCPLEVSFPEDETATAFAQISAAHLLPLIASYRPKLVSLNETEKRAALRKWRNVVRFEANPSDPLVVKLPEFRKSEFENANTARLDMLWGRLERSQRGIEPRVKEIIDAKRAEEMQLLSEAPRQTGDLSVLHNRIQHLQRLQQEYEAALEELKEKDIPKVPGRPVTEEAKLTNPNLLDRVLRTNHASAVFTSYNRIQRLFADATRYRLLENLLRDLLRAVDDALNFSLSWFRSAEVEAQARKLKVTGEGSMAWRGRLDYPHPHQRHIFDLRTLRTQDNHNIAVERLYRWATAGDDAVNDKTPLKYEDFLSDCIQYITASSSDTASQGFTGSIEEYNARRLPERVVSFFHTHYTKRFEDTNLFELLDKAAPRTQSGQTRPEQISGYLQEHLQHVKGLMRSLVAFEATLWHEGSSSLDASIYLSMHWHDGGQKQLLDEVISDLGSLTERGQSAQVNSAIDPHRLQVAYGQHAISLSTVRDFYKETNSAMEAYLTYQEEWEKNRRGNMSVHSSGQAQELVRNKWVLVRGQGAPGYGNSLYERVIRPAYSQNRAGAQPAGAQAAQGQQPGPMLP